MQNTQQTPSKSHNNVNRLNACKSAASQRTDSADRHVRLAAETRNTVKLISINYDDTND